MALGPIDSRMSVALPQVGHSAAQARGNPNQAPPASSATNVRSVAAPASDGVQADQNKARREEVESAVAKANKVVQATARDIEFTVDDQTDRTVVKVVDRATKEVIRQIPSEEMLRIAQALDHLQGLLVKQQA
jgi:flagellar protein FlaG